MPERAGSHRRPACSQRPKVSGPSSGPSRSLRSRPASGGAEILIGSLAVLPPVLILYGFAPSLAFALPALFVVGLVYISVLSGLSTVVQLRAPAELRGRVLSLYLVALGVSYPIGSLVQGPVADSLGLAWTTAVAGCLLAIALVLIRVLRPGVFRTLAARTSREVPPTSASS